MHNKTDYCVTLQSIYYDAKYHNTLITIVKQNTIKKIKKKKPIDALKISWQFTVSLLHTPESRGKQDPEVCFI
jgi:hypothetical protein